MNPFIEILNGGKEGFLPRSKLYNLEPIGVGTSYVESLRSYIGRLAFKHLLPTGTLIREVLIPELKNPRYIKNTDLFYGKSSSIVTFGNFTNECLKVLEELTSAKNLKNLTLTKWKNFFHNPSICHRYLRWCGVCYESFKERKVEIYEPLLWSIKEVNVCLKHNVILSSVCPHCHKKPISFTRKTTPGYCSRCEGWLGNMKGEVIDHSNKELIWDIYKAEEIAKLLEANPTTDTEISISNLKKTIKDLIEFSTNGNVSLFSKLINRDRKRVGNWNSGKELPDPESLLAICNTLNIELKELLLNRMKYENVAVNIRSKNKVLKPIKFSKNRSKQNINLQYLEENLINSYNNEYPPPSLNTLMERFEYYKIAEKFPQISGKIVRKHKEYRKKNNEERTQKICEEVKEIMQYLYINNTYPTEKEIKKLMSKPGNFRHPKVREIWQQTLSCLKD